MSRKFTRRKFMAATAAGAAAATFKFPMPAIAQAAPFKLGLLTVKTGPLAQGGIQMEQGVLTWLKEHDNKMAGRKVEFFSADTGGKPAGTKTKAQELIERDKVDVIVGPLAAFELLAITDYIREHKTPTLSLAGADDLTQRQPNPYFLRPSATSSQAMHPMGHYAAKEMGLKKAITIDFDFAFGYEQEGGFQSAFEKDGGCVLNKLWAPLGTPDYTPYLAQMTGCDVRLPGLCRLGPARLHEAICQLRPQISGGHRRDRRRRRAAARLRRRGGRHDELLPLHARSADRRQPEVRQGDHQGLQRRPRLLCRRPLRQLRRGRSRPQGRRRIDRGQGEVHGRAQGREAQGHAARADQASIISAT